MFKQFFGMADTVESPHQEERELDGNEEPVLKKSKRGGRRCKKVQRETEDAPGTTSDTASALSFANDGSFMQLFAQAQSFANDGSFMQQFAAAPESGEGDGANSEAANQYDFHYGPDASSDPLQASASASVGEVPVAEAATGENAALAQTADSKPKKSLLSAFSTKKKEVHIHSIARISPHACCPTCSLSPSDKSV